MISLQQYYCDTCYGDWFVLFFIIIIFVIFLIFGITEKIKEERQESRRRKLEIERRRYEATPEYQRELKIKKEKEQKAYEIEIESWKSKYPFAWNADIVFDNTLKTLGDQLPKCNKCNGHSMRIWKFSPQYIELRCVSCKKKHNYTQDYFDRFNQHKQKEFNLFFKGFSLKDAYVNYTNYLNRESHAPVNNPLYRQGRNLGDFSGMTAAHPDTYPLIIICQQSPVQKRRSKTKNEESEDYRSRRIEQSVKDAVWNRDGGKCVECGSRENLEFDHIIPWSKGGANTYRNLQLLCESCNRSKSDKIG